MSVRDGIDADAKPLAKRREWARQFFLFVFVGGLGTAINAGVYVSLIFFRWHYVAAGLAAWAFSVLIGNFLNGRLTFRSKVTARRSLPKVAAVYLAQQALSLGIITLLVEYTRVGPILAYAIAVPPAVAFSFLSMRYFAFRAA